MKMDTTLEGAKAVQDALEGMTEDVEQALHSLVMETAAGLAAGVVLRMQQGPHTGRIYKRRSVSHQASAPGEAPAPSDMAELIGSIYHEPEGRLTATAGSRLQKAVWMEFGTTKVAPRPAFVPEIEMARPEFLEGAAKILNVVIK